MRLGHELSPAGHHENYRPEHGYREHHRGAAWTQPEGELSRWRLMCCNLGEQPRPLRPTPDKLVLHACPIGARHGLTQVRLQATRRLAQRVNDLALLVIHVEVRLGQPPLPVEA